MTLRLNAAGLTDVGREREHNEDAIFYLVTRDESGETLGLFIVADGVGGQLAGELASQWAVAAVRDSLRDLFAPPNKHQTQPLDDQRTPMFKAIRSGAARPPRSSASLRERAVTAVQTGNLSVFGLTRERPTEAGNAGTTLTTALLHGERLVVTNVGDSRAYVLRGKELRQITRDHSLIAGLVESGNVKPEDVFTHPARNVIVRSLGRDPEVEIDVFEETLRAGDTLLLCSDGLWEMVRETQTIASIVHDAPTALDACRGLIDAANAGGGTDNISVIVVRVE
jgi:protein phosphatase